MDHTTMPSGNVYRLYQYPYIDIYQYSQQKNMGLNQLNPDRYQTLADVDSKVGLN